MSGRRRIRIIEVGPRDGLQNEPTSLSPGERVQLIRDLASAGLTEIEAGSFVSPRWVPQMAGTAEVLAGLSDLTGVALPVLVPNQRGLADAVAAGARDVALFVPATEGFARANLNASRQEALDRQLDVARSAQQAGLRLRGSVSVALVCPYEGAVDPATVIELCERLCNAGCHEVALCDTSGRATTEAVAVLAEMAVRRVGAEHLAAHMHDTGGLALANTAACLEAGITAVDAAVGGLGGCPFSPGARGNLSTNALLRWLDAEGYETGIDIDALDRIEQRLRDWLGRSTRHVA
jgi:hydroxymethylglutaryl-CoA lyase